MDAQSDDARVVPCLRSAGSPGHSERGV